MEKRGHKGWHSRGYLPHLDAGEELQSLTFRLEDSLPRAVVARWREELELEGGGEALQNRELQKKIARYEDAGYGKCYLREAACAEIVQNALLYFDGDRYRVLEWCVMPNHVHVLMHLGEDDRMGDVVKSWKTFSAQGINEIVGRKGPLWAVDYHDRYIRNEKHLINTRSYIRNNPGKAGLCGVPEEWRWGSAWDASIDEF